MDEGEWHSPFPDIVLIDWAVASWRLSESIRRPHQTPFQPDDAYLSGIHFSKIPTKMQDSIRAVIGTGQVSSVGG